MKLLNHTFARLVEKARANGIGEFYFPSEMLADAHVLLVSGSVDGRIEAIGGRVKFIFV